VTEVVTEVAAALEETGMGGAEMEVEVEEVPGLACN